MFKKKLGLLAGVATLASLLVPLAASPAFASPTPLPGYYAEQSGGYWTCFGQKATITQPGPDGIFYATGGKDVIVGTDGNDEIYGVGPGSVVCSRGGNDTISTVADANAKTGWNRVKVDAGTGNDDVNVDYDVHDWGNPAAKWLILEAHTGPGDDTVEGGGGNDQIYADGGADRISCTAGKYDVLHRIPGESVWQDGCDKTVDATAYATVAKFHPSTGSWSLVCPGQPSKTATWYVNATSYGATNPCATTLIFASGTLEGNGPSTVIHVTPVTKFTLNKAIAKDGIVRNITFQQWSCSPGETHYVTHASGPMTVVNCSSL